MSDAALQILAIAALSVAAVSLVVSLTLFLKLRRIRTAQTVLLGSGKDDLVDFAVSLQTRIDDVHRAVDEVALALTRVDKRIDGCLSNTSIVRYDAYEDAGGHQSASLALPRRLAQRARRQRHPGPRLREDLREGDRPRALVRDALPRGAGRRRPRDGGDAVTGFGAATISAS